MSLLRPIVPVPPSPESVFAAKYEWLFGWAMHFSQGDRATAEDLVQDTYVRFVLSCPEVKDPDKAEPLLYTYLKYVHLAHLRRLQRYPHEQLSPAEYDSLEISLRANPSGDLIELQEELRRIVTYLAWRKETSKSASMLILRFLHGYFPEEIMRIGLVRRSRVDNGVATAREELKRHLGAPGKVVAFDGGSPVEVKPRHSAVPADRLVEELRSLVSQSCHGLCLPVDVLRERYRRATEPISRELLAHLVSCERCLEVVGRLPGSPPNSRHPLERVTAVRGKLPSRQKQKSSALDEMLTACNKRVREVMEHRPRRLMVVVNGQVLAVQNVTSAESRQEVEVSSGAPLELIEVMSEQGICMLALPVGALAAGRSPEVIHRVELSGGRSVEVRLNFASVCSQVHVAYIDPSWAVESLIDEEEVQSVNPGSLARKDREPVRRSAESLRRWIAGLWSQLVSHMNPTFATAVVLALASIFLFISWYTQRPVITAALLLQSAEKWDTGMRKSAEPGVIYQKVEIRTARRTISRTLYRDAQGMRRPRKSKLNAEDEATSELLASAGINWDEPLAVSPYRDWRNHAEGVADIVKRDGSGSLVLTTKAVAGPIAQESLTVRESDFHPTKRRVVLRAGETIEVAELNYDILPWAAINQDWFEPIGTGFNMRRGHAEPIAHPVIPLTDMQLDGAELGARLALSDLHADTDARLRITRGASGIIVNGIVDNAARKHEIEARLRQVLYVSPQIESIDDLRSRSTPDDEVVNLTQTSDVATVSPLETFLAGSGMNHAAIVDLSQRLLSSAVAVEQRSRMMRDLYERFGSGEQLKDASRKLWTDLLRDQQGKLLLALQEEERTLAATGLVASATSHAAGAKRMDLAALGEHNFSLCKEVASGGEGGGPSVPALLAGIEEDVHSLRADALALERRMQSAADDPVDGPHQPENR